MMDEERWSVGYIERGSRKTNELMHTSRTIIYRYLFLLVSIMGLDSTSRGNSSKFFKSSEVGPTPPLEFTKHVHSGGCGPSVGGVVELKERGPKGLWFQKGIPSFAYFQKI